MPADAPADAPAPVRRVVVRVHPAQRELLDDLGAVGPRHRAERLRSLALLGLAALRGGIGTLAGSPPTPPTERAPAVDSQLERRLRLLNSVAPDE